MKTVEELMENLTNEQTDFLAINAHRLSLNLLTEKNGIKKIYTEVLDISKRHNWGYHEARTAADDKEESYRRKLIPSEIEIDNLNTHLNTYFTIPKYKNTGDIKLISRDILDKYLTKEAQKIVYKSVYNTVHEEVFIKKEGTDHINTVYGRKVYFVNYFGVKVICKDGENEPTEEQIAKFCTIINELVSDGIIAIGSLMPTSMMELQQLDKTQPKTFILLQYSCGAEGVEAPPLKTLTWNKPEGVLPDFTIN